MRHAIVASIAALWLALIISSAAAQTDEIRGDYGASVLELNVTFQVWDEDRPWLKKQPQNRSASAVLVGPRLALTTAQMLDHATFVQLEIRGGASRAEPKIVRVDRSVNLALLSIDEETAAELEPVKVADRTPTSGTLRTVRWRRQQLEAAASRVIRFEVERSLLGHVNHAFVKLRTDLAAGGWAEPVFSGGSLVGITVSQSGDESRAIPAEILSAFMKRGALSPDTGSFTTLGVNWQVNRDSAVSRFLGQEGEPEGILIREVPWGTTACGVIKPRDILLEIDGEHIDAEGYYHHPRLGRLKFEHILAERYQTGDSIPARVLRSGGEQEVALTARAYPASMDLVPFYQFTPPPYVILGGLVVRELDFPYLYTWGKDWSKDAPDRLISRYYYRSQGQTPDRRRIVLITSVLPSAYNIGYHDVRDEVIERINGHTISKIEDVLESIDHPEDGFHVIDLAPESSYAQIILDASTLQAATDEILETYGVPAASRPREGPLPTGNGDCAGDY